jgi:DnaJ homolog subfamily C member 9
VGSEFNEETFQSAYDYFRKIFKPISQQDIQDFAKDYRDSPMEQEDLLDYYQQHKGDMKQLLECIPLSTWEDVPRFLAFFEKQIALKTIPNFKAFSNSKDKVRPLANEEKEFEEANRQDTNALVLAIQNKAPHRFDFLESLEQKYGVGKKQKIAKKEEKEGKEKAGKGKPEKKKNEERGGVGRGSDREE